MDRSSDSSCEVSDAESEIEKPRLTTMWRNHSSSSFFYCPREGRRVPLRVLEDESVDQVLCRLNQFASGSLVSSSDGDSMQSDADLHKRTTLDGILASLCCPLPRYFQAASAAVVWNDERSHEVIRRSIGHENSGDALFVCGGLVDGLSREDEVSYIYDDMWVWVRNAQLPSRPQCPDSPSPVKNSPQGGCWAQLRSSVSRWGHSMIAVDGEFLVFGGFPRVTLCPQWYSARRNEWRPAQMDALFKIRNDVVNTIERRSGSERDRTADFSCTFTSIHNFELTTMYGVIGSSVTVPTSRARDAPARYLHSVVSIDCANARCSLIIYGGLISSACCDDTTIRLDVLSDGTLRYREVDTVKNEAHPGPRYGHAAVYHEVSRSMLLYGGADLEDKTSRYLHKLQLDTSVWVILDTLASITPRMCHNAFLDHSGLLWIFGGDRPDEDDPSEDAPLLTVNLHTGQVEESRSQEGTFPGSTSGMSHVVFKSDVDSLVNRVFIFGGEVNGRSGPLASQCDVLEMVANREINLGQVPACIVEDDHQNIQAEGDVASSDLCVVMRTVQSHLDAVADRLADLNTKVDLLHARLDSTNMELLRYVSDTAEALDYLYESYSLQHLDVKPENILILSGRAKLGDFGLVKNLYERSASLVGGLTPTYAPPELFEGKPNRHSDQYGLALVYTHMLTGILPFPSGSTAQIAAAHLHGVPDLSALPRAQRPVIARALSKDPALRFASCTDLIVALKDSLRADEPSPARPAATASGSAAHPAPVNHQTAHRSTTSVVPAARPSTSSAPTPSTKITPLKSTSAERQQTNQSHTGPGSEPTILIGVGGLGVEVLTRLVDRLNDRFGPADQWPPVEMIVLDSNARTLSSRFREQDLDHVHVVPIPIKPADAYGSQTAEMLRWLGRRWFYNIPRDLTTNGYRPLGRLALVSNGARVRTALASVIEKAASQCAGTDKTPRITLIGGIGGGTGSGAIPDLAYAIRSELKRLGLPHERLQGVLLHATPRSHAERDKSRANAHALLRELHHFSAPRQSLSGRTATGSRAVPRR